MCFCVLFLCVRGMGGTLMPSLSCPTRPHIRTYIYTPIHKSNPIQSHAPAAGAGGARLREGAFADAAHGGGVLVLSLWGMGAVWGEQGRRAGEMDDVCRLSLTEREREKANPHLRPTHPTHTYTQTSSTDARTRSRSNCLRSASRLCFRAAANSARRSMAAMGRRALEEEEAAWVDGCVGVVGVGCGFIRRGKEREGVCVYEKPARTHRRRRRC